MIPADIDTTTVKNICHRLSQIYSEIQFDYGFYNRELKKIDQKIKLVETLGATRGHNEAERKSNGILAAKNFEENGAVLDLYEYRNQLFTCYSDLETMKNYIDFAFDICKISGASIRTEASLVGR